ncbi:MAG: hypothetical protein IJA69_03015 [Clostridia bacterium]|nr:hypothetical protein [Clostridia bacterium]
MKYLNYIEKDVIANFLKKYLIQQTYAKVDKEEAQVVFERYDEAANNWLAFISCTGCGDIMVDMSDFEISPEGYSEKWGEFVFGQLKLSEATGDAPYGLSEEYWTEYQKVLESKKAIENKEYSCSEF